MRLLLERLGSRSSGAAGMLLAYCVSNKPALLRHHRSMSSSCPAWPGLPSPHVTTTPAHVGNRGNNNIIIMAKSYTRMGTKNADKDPLTWTCIHSTGLYTHLPVHLPHIRSQRPFQQEHVTYKYPLFILTVAHFIPAHTIII